MEIEIEIKDVSVEQTVAKSTDYLILQDPETGITYKIRKANFLAGISTPVIPIIPTIPTYIYLPLIETTGIAAIDISGNTRNATYVNTTLNVNGSILDSNSRISLDTSMDALSILSIGLEFKTASNSNQGLWEFRASQDLSSGVFTPALTMNVSGKLGVYGYPSGSGYVSQMNEDGTFHSYNDNVWHKSIVVMSGNSIKIFVDKIKILDIISNPITAFIGFFSIGATRANGNFIGQVKNFRVWNSALSDSQAADLS